MGKYCIWDSKNGSLFFKCSVQPQESAETYNCNCNFNEYCEFNYTLNKNECKTD